VVGAPARFTVETAAAGTGELEVVVLSPKGTPEKVVVRCCFWAFNPPIDISEDIVNTFIRIPNKCR